jgi:hypothetical protein
VEIEGRRGSLGATIERGERSAELLGATSEVPIQLDQRILAGERTAPDLEPEQCPPVRSIPEHPSLRGVQRTLGGDLDIDRGAGTGETGKAPKASDDDRLRVPRTGETALGDDLLDDGPLIGDRERSGERLPEGGVLAHCRGIQLGEPFS